MLPRLPQHLSALEPKDHLILVIMDPTLSPGAPALHRDFTPKQKCGRDTMDRRLWHSSYLLLLLKKVCVFSIQLRSVSNTSTKNTMVKSFSLLLLKLVFNSFLISAGLVKVAIVAEGEDDPKGTGRTSIKVNGIERSPMQRGHNVVVLDSDRNFIMAANFDTADPSKGEGVKMANFLQQLPQERIVLIGTQGTTGKYLLASS